MSCGICGYADALRSARAVWENGSSDTDGTNTELSGMGGLSFGGGDTDTNVYFNTHGTLVGGVLTRGSSHLHQETAAARRCAPPTLERSNQALWALIAWACGIAAIVAAVYLFNHLHEIGFAAGSHHFRNLPPNISRLCGRIWKEAIAFTLGSWLAVLLVRYISSIRQSERATFESSMDLWLRTYYCERDGWVGIP